MDSEKKEKYYSPTDIRERFCPILFYIQNDITLFIERCKFTLCIV